jgi:hypothetical protein
MREEEGVRRCLYSRLANFFALKPECTETELINIVVEQIWILIVLRDTNLKSDILDFNDEEEHHQ